jgi:hypothetical protein
VRNAAKLSGGHIPFPIFLELLGRESRIRDIMMFKVFPTSTGFQYNSDSAGNSLSHVPARPGLDIYPWLHNWREC